LFQIRIEMLPTSTAVMCLSLDNIAIQSKTLGCDNRTLGADVARIGRFTRLGGSKCPGDAFREKYLLPP
jgi:hypothetical protein